AARHPVVVAPAISFEIENDRCGLWRLLAPKGVWVALLQQMAVRRADAVLVGVSVFDLRNEARPDAAVARFERELPVLPSVGVADHADFAGVGSPDGETDSFHAVVRGGVGSKILIHGRLHAVG